MAGIQLRLSLVLSGVTCLLIANCKLAEGEQLYLVEVKNPDPVNEKTLTYIVSPNDRASITKVRRTNLAAPLLATLDARGELKGSDEDGRPVIAISERNLAALQNSTAVRSGTTKSVQGSAWKPIIRLKLSYQDAPIDEKEAKALGVKIVDSYAKGSFVIVEPLKGKIDAKLLEKLEKHPGIRYATPVFDVKAINQVNH